MEKVFCFMIIAVFMKGCGKMILSMVKDFKNSPTNACFRGSTSMGSLKV